MKMTSGHFEILLIRLLGNPGSRAGLLGLGSRAGLLLRHQQSEGRKTSSIGLWNDEEGIVPHLDRDGNDRLVKVQDVDDDVLVILILHFAQGNHSQPVTFGAGDGDQLIFGNLGHGAKIHFLGIESDGSLSQGTFEYLVNSLLR